MWDRKWPTASFAGRLTTDERHRLLDLGGSNSFQAGDYLMRQGETGNYLLVIHSGHVKVIGADGRGRGYLLGVRGPGELLGELSYLSNGRRTASVVALRVVTTARLGSEQFSKFLNRHPRVALEVARTVADRLCAADQSRLELTEFGVDDRVLRVLLEMAEVFRTGPTIDEVEIPLSQLEIAQLVSAAEVSVQRALRRLGRHGLVGTAYRRVVVPSLTRLQKATEADPNQERPGGGPATRRAAARQSRSTFPQ